MPQSHSALTLRIPQQCPLCGATGRVRIETFIHVESVVLLWRCANCDQSWSVSPPAPDSPVEAIH
jgi:hypothetical protein